MTSKKNRPSKSEITRKQTELPPVHLVFILYEFVISSHLDRSTVCVTEKRLSKRDLPSWRAPGNNTKYRQSTSCRAHSHHITSSSFYNSWYLRKAIQTNPLKTSLKRDQLPPLNFVSNPEKTMAPSISSKAIISLFIFLLASSPSVSANLENPSKPLVKQCCACVSLGPALQFVQFPFSFHLF